MVLKRVKNQVGGFENDTKKRSANYGGKKGGRYLEKDA